MYFLDVLLHLFPFLIFIMYIIQLNFKDPNIRLKSHAEEWNCAVLIVVLCDSAGQVLLGPIFGGDIISVVTFANEQVTRLVW